MQDSYTYIIRSADAISGTSNSFKIFVPKPQVPTNKFMMIFRSIYVFTALNGHNYEESPLIEVQCDLASNGPFSYETTSRAGSKVIGYGVLSGTVFETLQKNMKVVFVEGGNTHTFELYDPSTNALYLDSADSAPNNSIIHFELIPM